MKRLWTAGPRHGPFLGRVPLLRLRAVLLPAVRTAVCVALPVWLRAELHADLRTGLPGLRGLQCGTCLRAGPGIAVGARDAPVSRHLGQGTGGRQVAAAFSRAALGPADAV